MARATRLLATFAPPTAGTLPGWRVHGFEADNPASGGQPSISHGGAAGSATAATKGVGGVCIRSRRAGTQASLCTPHGFRGRNRLDHMPSGILVGATCRRGWRGSGDARRFGGAGTVGLGALVSQGFSVVRPAAIDTPSPCRPPMGTRG